MYHPHDYLTVGAWPEGFYMNTCKEMKTCLIIDYNYIYHSSMVRGKIRSCRSGGVLRGFQYRIEKIKYAYFNKKRNIHECLNVFYKSYY